MKRAFLAILAKVPVVESRWLLISKTCWETILISGRTINERPVESGIEPARSEIP
jgi:hypothetical protein